MTEDAPALRCRGLVKRYGEVVAVDGLDLEVRRGECFGLLGPNGAGKTTTVEILEGLIEPTGGEVEVLGERWGDGRDERLRQRLGVALQETYFPDKLTVSEVVRLFRSFYDSGREVEETVELVDLGEKLDARVEELSGGQKQRLSLACALVGRPELLFLDEPTTGLDPQARLALWKIVERFEREGGTVLLTTHYMEEAARLCDRVAIVDRGRRIALGSPAELVDSLGAEQIVEIELDGEIPESELTTLRGVEGVARRNGAYVLTVSDVGRVMRRLLARLQAEEVELDRLATHHATLEDVFVHLTGRGLRDE